MKTVHTHIHLLAFFLHAGPSKKYNLQHCKEATREGTA